MNGLLVIDIQNDFCPGGALAIENGDDVVPVINRLAARFGHVLQTQDWHTENHNSFASSHTGKEPYQTIQAPYGEQVLWPDHCVRGTSGAAFHPDLETKYTEIVIRKGFRREIDSYSSFYENDQKTKTGLTGYLHERGFTDIYVTGLATDFCVKWSVLDGIREGFNMHVIEDAVKGIDIDGSVEIAWKEMRAAGATILHSEDLSENM